MIFAILCDKYKIRFSPELSLGEYLAVIPKLFIIQVEYRK